MVILGLVDRLRNSWNAFKNKNPTVNHNQDGGYYYRPDRLRTLRGNERSMVTSIFNRIAMDVAAVDIRHCRLDDSGRFLSYIESGLDNCLSVEANIDQTGRAFIQDMVMTMLEEGCVASLPIDTDRDPNLYSSYEILTMRNGKVREWFPDKVRVEVYNDRNSRHEEIIANKRNVALIENPLYAVVNEPNSTVQRLMRKLALLDIVDEQSGSGKLDLIIQLPYIVKTPTRRAQAEERRKDIERQLAGSKYGIAYTDGTEHITQLNRPLENNLLKTIEYLMNLMNSQLGITQGVMDGTADEKTMLNYNNRTIEPLVSAIVLEYRRKFLTKTARSQLQSILYFRDPFRLVPVNEIAEIADKFTRNEIMTSNEIRQIVGMKPSDDPKADKLVNSNLNHPDEEGVPNGNSDKKPPNNPKEGG